MKQLIDAPNAQIHVHKWVVLEDDLIHGFDLQKVKKYMRVDGAYEDDVLELMLIACVRQVEDLNNVSLTGKLIEAVLAIDRICEVQELIPYLPYPPICEVQSCDYMRGYHCLTYETQRSDNPQWFIEVCNLMLKKYEERGKDQIKKTIYL